jgi:hypothetical protein
MRLGARATLFAGRHAALQYDNSDCWQATFPPASFHQNNDPELKAKTP